MSNHSNKVAWVTGASQGIGKAIALKLADNGYHVFITARSEDKLKEIAEHKNISALVGDITKIGRMKDIVKEITESKGRLDLAILNAGTYLPDGVDDFTASNLKKQFEINLNGTANCLEAALNYFKAKKKGHIAIVASVAGYRGLPQSLSYGGTKAALINMAEGLAAEIKGKKDLDIKVQIVCPGFIETPLTDKNEFEMPMLMKVDDAADSFYKGLHSNKFEITFPWLFAFLTKTFGRLSPNGFYIWCVSKMKEKLES